MKQPNECENMNDIRNEIDNIDFQIVKLIGVRGKYVHTASRFKKSRSDVKAQDRVKSMLQKRRNWAEDEKIEPDIIEKLFSILVDYFIGKEMNYWEKEN